MKHSKNTLFHRAVTYALEYKHMTLQILSSKLECPYEKAYNIMQELVATGVLESVDTPGPLQKTLITRPEEAHKKRVFQIGRGYIDWVCASTKEEAISFLANLIGAWVEEFEGSEVVEIPKEKWGDLYIIDFDCMEPDEGEYDKSLYTNGYKIIDTFEGFLKDKEEPTHIAANYE